MTTDRVEKLQAMGIQVWVRRDRQAAPSAPEEVRMPLADLRVRLGAGTGDWLIITPEDRPAGSERMVTDLQSLIGSENCRFGQWTDHAQAGNTMEELSGQGIRYILALAPCSGLPGEGLPNLVGPADISGLMTDGEARKRLWHQLRELLGS